MLSQNRRLPTLVLFGVLAACAQDLDLDSTVVDPTSVVTAQFDPSNPIPVLQLIPSPTGLAQVVDADSGQITAKLDQEAIAPESCELPTVAQCLAFSDGWPTSALPTLYFSGGLDETTIADGVKLYERKGDGLVERTYTATISARPPINPSCQDGDNGSSPPRTYTEDDIPAGLQLVLTPDAPFELGTDYFVVVLSDSDGGLRDTDGARVEASALFSILNAPLDATPDEEPVSEEGALQSALLRAQVNGSVLNTLFPGKRPEELTADEQDALVAGVAATGQDLRSLYLFFKQTLAVLANDASFEQGTAPFTEQSSVLYANFWSTAENSGTTEIQFDPAAGLFPFPNAELFTREADGDTTVFIPPAAGDSASAAALKAGLNTLTGFSNTAPILVTASADLEATNIANHVHMYQVDADGDSVGEVDVTVEFLPASEDAPSTLKIAPTMPLNANTEYVLGIVSTTTTPLNDADGNPVRASSLYQLLRDIADPFISSGGNVLEDALIALQCSDVAETGALLDEQSVKEAATLIESEEGVAHPKWTETLDQFKAASGFENDEILLAWRHRTQDLTGTLDAIQAGNIDSGAWEMDIGGGGDIVGPIGACLDNAGIAALLDVPGSICVPICQLGLLTGVAANACGTTANPSAAVLSHPLCAGAVDLTSSDLNQLCLYELTSYRVTSGNPLASGTFTSSTVVSPRPNIIPFWVATPDGNVSSPAVLFQHGIGRFKEDGLFVANAFAKKGWATVLMDLPFHGQRASDIMQDSFDPPVPCVDGDGVPDVDPRDVLCSGTTTATCTGGCDDVRDASGTGFLSSNVFAARDNFRQAVVDHLTLMRSLIREGQVAGVVPEVDGSELGLVGTSLGGLAFGNLMAFLGPEDVAASALNTAGGGLLSNILLDAPPIITTSLYQSLSDSGVCELLDEEDPSQGCRDTPAFRQFQILGQMAVDPGDPLGVSIAVHEDLIAKTLFQVSEPDQVISNAGSDALGNAYGFDIETSDQYQVFDYNGAQGCHPFFYSPVTFRDDSPFPILCGTCINDALCRTILAQEQVATFVDTGGATIIDTTVPANIGALPCTCN